MLCSSLLALVLVAFPGLILSVYRNKYAFKLVQNHFFFYKQVIISQLNILKSRYLLQSAKLLLAMPFGNKELKYLGRKTIIYSKKAIKVLATQWFCFFDKTAKNKQQNNEQRQKHTIKIMKP